MKQSLLFRAAGRPDVPAIVAMLADDHLGREREVLSDPLAPSYYAAFDAIAADPNNELVVALSEGEIVATLQITYVPSLSRQGSWHAVIESVRTKAERRGQGIGEALVRYAIERARDRGCSIMQLSTHKSRSDARRFYERLGFSATHEGMKLSISDRK